MANAIDFRIAGNDEHGLNPPTVGKRTPIMPYINRPFYENEFNFPAKNFFLATCARVNFLTYDVKPERQDIAVPTRVTRTDTSGSSLVVTFAYNATVNENFNSWGGIEVFYSPQNIQAARSRVLSENIYARVKNNGYTRGIRVDALYNVGMISSVRIPASLIEAGFMTNFNEAKLMVDPDYQMLIADLAVRGVCDYLAVPYRELPATNFPVVQRGSRGTAVSYLQFMLINYGYNVAADGIFGAGTETAVRAFQQKNSLTADGVVGGMTWAKVNNINPQSVTLRKGSRGVETWYMQFKLLSKLYPVGTVDGVFGAATENAVRAFQQENGLVADGIVGRGTWAKLRPIGGGRSLS